jgi:hypothetical protein
MLRMYFLLVWYDLADEALEDAIYDSGYGSSPSAVSMPCDKEVYEDKLSGGIGA